MKFSILVPIYNKESYLKECIDSLLIQRGDYEILLVDDGSTDGSPELCDRYAKEYPNIRAIHKKNGGLVSARESGIQNATGDYLLFVDADDSVQPDMVSKLTDVLNTVSVDMILFGANEINESGRNDFIKPVLPKGIFSDKAGLYDQFFLTYSLNAMWIKCCKAGLFQGLDFSAFHDCNYGEDMLISAPLFRKATSFLYLPDNLYNYKTYSGMMVNYNPVFYASYKKVNQLTVKELQSENIPDLSKKAGIHLLRSAYSAVIRFRYAKETDQEILKSISQDSAFRSAYDNARFTKYAGWLSKKEKLIIDQLYQGHFSVIRSLISLQRIRDQF